MEGQEIHRRTSPSAAETETGGINELDKTMYDVLIQGLDIRTLIMNTMIPGLDIAPTNNFLNKAKMERSRLRRRMGMRYAVLNPIIEELSREGRIRISGNIITLERVI
jgi:hypothetical protein